MPCFRPATPGFVVTLVATALLAIVSFSVPWIRSVYFLKATVQGFDGSLTFGTLGYCLQQANGTTCSKPSIGYQLDVNTLLGNNTQIQIPNVVVKWVTYALVLHVVALGLAGVSAVFGLLAHVREMSTTCCSTCVSGFAAAVALLAFAFDLALFFLTKSRINSVAGGSAVMGNAIWLTLAAFFLLFFSGFFYCFGRCCISDRPRGSKNKKMDPDYEGGDGDYADHLRLDAVKAEADRKHKQKLASETGLPAFQEYQPLHKYNSSTEYYDDGDRIVRVEGDIGQSAGVDAGMAAYDAHGADGGYIGGYAQAPLGTRAVDEYYTPALQPSNSQYPPQQLDRHHNVAATGYPYSTTPTPVPLPQVQLPYSVPGNQYGHSPSGSHYQSVDQKYPTSYSPAPDASVTGYNSEYQPNPYASPTPPPGNYYSQSAQQQNERPYNLSGGGYATNAVSHLQSDAQNPYTQHSTPPPMMHSPPPLASDLQARQPATHGHHSLLDYQYEDSPPVYDEAHAVGDWSNRSYAI